MNSIDGFERVVAALRQLTRKSQILQGGTLVERIMRETDMDAASIRAHFKEMRTRGWLQAGSWSATGNPVGRVGVNLPALPAPSWVHSWSEALHACAELSESDRLALLDCGACLSDMSAAEYPKILRGLVRLRAEQATLAGLPVFIVSARYLRGSSKMLNKLGQRSLRAFGIDVSHFTDHPPYVVTAGARDPAAVVLIENPAAFELAVKTSAVRHCAFISTFGFGLSKASEDYGNQLAYIVENGLSSAVTLVREDSQTSSAKTLLSHRNITFWGDLDMAGLQIYERLASRLPSLSLSALYEPMIDAITVHDTCHPYVNSVGKAGQKMFGTTRADSLAMLEICKVWAVDQEIVAAEQVERLAGRILSPPGI